MIIFFVLFSTLILYSQSSHITNENFLIGVWQVNDTIMAAGLDDVYRFYPDGSFNFDVGYGYVSRLIRVVGTYSIEKDLILFNVSEVIESEGGEISFGDDESDYNNWTYINDYAKIKKYKKRKDFYAELLVISKDGIKEKCIKLQNIFYYKINDNPNAFMDCCCKLKFMEIR